MSYKIYDIIHLLDTPKNNTQVLFINFFKQFSFFQNTYDI